MTETASEAPPEQTADAPAESGGVALEQAGTPILVWILYALGAIAATVFVGSIAFVAVAYATAGNGGAGVDVSMPALILWLALALAAFATFVWRRWGRQR